MTVTLRVPPRSCQLQSLREVGLQLYTRRPTASHVLTVIIKATFLLVRQVTLVARTTILFLNDTANVFAYVYLPQSLRRTLATWQITVHRTM